MKPRVLQKLLQKVRQVTVKALPYKLQLSVGHEVVKALLQEKAKSTHLHSAALAA